MNAKCPKRSASVLVSLYVLLCNLLLPMSSAQLLPSGEKHGLVNGVVLDDMGAPIGGATIIVTKLNGVEEGQTVTDADGRYSLRVDYGEFTVVGTKEQDAFPDCRLNLFSCNPPKYRVTEAAPAVAANLKLTHAARIKGRV